MIDQYDTQSNEILLAACGSIEEAEGSVHGEISYFTKYLIENISKDTDMTYEELIAQVTQQLKEQGIKTQNPIIEGDTALKKSKIFNYQQNFKTMANSEITINISKWKVEKKDVQKRLDLNNQLQLTGDLRVKTISPYFKPVKAYLLTADDSLNTGQKKQGILFVYNDLGRPNRGNSYKYDIVLHLNETTQWDSKQSFIQTFFYNESTQKMIDNRMKIFEMILSHDKYQKFTYSRLDTILQNCDNPSMSRDQYFDYIAFLEATYPDQMFTDNDPEEADPHLANEIPDQTSGGVVIPLNFTSP